MTVSLCGIMANWGRNFLQKFHNKLKNCKVRVEKLRSSIDESRVIEFFLMRKDVLSSYWRMQSCIGSSGLRLFG